MPKNNTQEPQPLETPTVPQIYSAGDLWDAYHIAKSDLNWCDVAITDLRSKFIEHKEYMVQNFGMHTVYFEQIETFFDMYEYLIGNRLDFYSKEAEVYKAEHEANKKAVTL